MSLAALLSYASPDLDAIGTFLDELDHRQRLTETRALGMKQQRRLFDAADQKREIGLEYMVPESLGPMNEVVHHGTNTLPAFREFAKVFVRPDAGPEGELWGYNRNSALLETAVGPGYFVAYPHSADGELLIDYCRIPPRHPAGWPPILRNDQRLSRFVYNQTQDVLRGVSKHVSIGRATKNGKGMPAYFVLCRQDR